MMRNKTIACVLNRLFSGAVLAALVSSAALAQAPTPPAPIMPPLLPTKHVVDLATSEGSAVMSTQWRISEVKIVEVPAIKSQMPAYKTTYNIEPRAGGVDFDDSKWAVIDGKDLGGKRTGGHVAFMWYRTTLTIPPKIGSFDPTNAFVVLHVLVDDYAEVWVNGEIARKSGYPSPATMQGHNMPNRVVLTTKASPGDKFQIAIFGVNGPISVAPENTIWFREAKVQFY